MVIQPIHENAHPIQFPQGRKVDEDGKENKQMQRKTINEILKREVAFINLPRMCQALRNLAIIEHAWGRAWKRK